MTQPTPTQNAALITMARWVSTIADNIRNPISGISAALSILETQLQTAQSHAARNQPLVDDALIRIRGRLTSLSAYVSELIDFAKPAVIDLQPTDLLAVLSAAMRDMTAGLPGIETHTVAPANAVLLEVDHERLRIVLAGILRNAAEAAMGNPGADHPRVKVAIHRTPQKVTIEVSDNGPGFTELAMKHACEPFFSTKEAGTGLGLALAAKVARAHGGQITIERSALGGAKVSMHLPDTKHDSSDLMPSTES
ncbi:MAG: HAMP domain-containing histidine kinase [Deltaproteobacteria bacterium]|nr:HAMP domain-containing histidine kinase [Deltaproteobacteria bacterium]